MDFLWTFGRQTFASLRVRNYRFYFFGIGISQIGTWMQAVALGWLVLELTGSGTLLGGLLALRFAPLFFGGLFGGTIVDRFDKRTLLYVTQLVSAVLALTLSALVFFDAIALWMLYASALFFGLIDVVDRPARQTFIHEMVGRDNLRNAVSLNSAEVNLARTIGPLFAGVLIATVGTAFCFFANALSYVIFFIFLTLLKSEELHQEQGVERRVDHVFSGLRYVASQPLILTILVVMSIIGTFTYEFQTSLPLLVHTTFLGSAADYAALLSAMGAGSVAGGLYSAGRSSLEAREFILWGLLFGVSVSIAALMPTLGLTAIVMIFVGFFSISMTSVGNAMIQLGSDAHMRGRVMSLWTMAIFGSTLFGAPIIGWVGEHASPRAALFLGGVAAIAAALYAARRHLEWRQLFSIPAFVSIRREEASVEDTKV